MRQHTRRAVITGLLMVSALGLNGCGLGDMFGGATGASAGGSSSGATANPAQAGDGTGNPQAPATTDRPVNGPAANNAANGNTAQGNGAGAVQPPAPFADDGSPKPQSAFMTTMIYNPLDQTLQEALAKGWVAKEDATKEAVMIPYHGLIELSTEYVKGPWTLRIPGSVAQKSQWTLHTIVSPTLDEAVEKGWVTRTDAKKGFGIIVTETFEFLSTEYTSGQNVTLYNDPFGVPRPGEGESTRIEQTDGE